MCVCENGGSCLVYIYSLIYTHTTNTQISDKGYNGQDKIAKKQRDVNKSSKLGFVHEPLKITWVAELFHKAQLVAVAEKK